MELDGALWCVLAGLAAFGYYTISLAAPAALAPAPGERKKKRTRPTTTQPSKRAAEIASLGVSRSSLRNGVVLVDANNVRGCVGFAACDAAQFCGALARWSKSLGVARRVLVVVDHGPKPRTFFSGGLGVQFAGARETADDAIVRDAAAAGAAGLSPVVVVTSDAELKRRAKAAHAAAAPLTAPPIRLVPSADACDKWLHGGGGGAAPPTDDEWVVVKRGHLYDHVTDPTPGWHAFGEPRDAPPPPTKRPLRVSACAGRETTSSRVAQAGALFARLEDAAAAEDDPEDAPGPVFAALLAETPSQSVN